MWQKRTGSFIDLNKRAQDSMGQQMGSPAQHAAPYARAYSPVGRTESVSEMGARFCIVQPSAH
jgi:hypothetical protein